MAQKYCSQQRQDVTEYEAGGSCWKTGKWSFIKWLKNWVKICRIIAVLRDCEVKMWRPSGLSSSVILSSAFSSLVLPSTWQGFPLHSWLYNLSLCLSLNHSHSCVCVCSHAYSHVCLFIWLGGACKPVICAAFWEDLWNYCSYSISVYQIYKAIWPINKALVHYYTTRWGIPFIHPLLIIFLCVCIHVVCV